MPTSLSRDAAYIKAHEQNYVQGGIINVSQMYRAANGMPVDLNVQLDTNTTYLWILKENDPPAEADMLLGTEPVINGLRYGHPTISTAGVIGGELNHNVRRGWVLDNNSGRFGTGNIDARATMRMSKKRLIIFAAGMLEGQSNLRVGRIEQLSQHVVKRFLFSPSHVDRPTTGWGRRTRVRY